MSTPFTYGSLTNMPNGAGAGTDNITGLANGKALGLGVVTAGATSVTALIAPMEIETGSGTITGTVSRYLITSEDNTLWTDGISPTSTSDQSGKIVTATLIDIINVSVATTSYKFKEVDVLSVLGLTVMPNYWSIVVQNNSNATFSATAGLFSTEYVPVTWA